MDEDYAKETQMCIVKLATRSVSVSAALFFVLDSK